MNYSFDNLSGGIYGGIAAAATQTEVVVSGLPDPNASNLRALDVLRRVPGDRIVGTMEDARRVAAGLLEG